MPYLVSRRRCVEGLGGYHITNDWESSATDIVFSANDRCDQENLIQQHKHGVPVLTAPLDSLNSNWAYMVMASRAWSRKAWSALLLPVSARWQAKHAPEKQRLLRMAFVTYRNAFINIPAQIVRTRKSRQLLRGIRLIAAFA